MENYDLVYFIYGVSYFEMFVYCILLADILYRKSMTML